MELRIPRPPAAPAAALVDRSARGKIVVSGADRRSYLHALLTNDIAALSAGKGCYAAYLTPQGRLIADLRLFDLGDVLLLDVHAGVTKAVLEKLDQFVFSEDVRFGDVTDVFAILGVHGPDAATVLVAGLRSLGFEPPEAHALNAWPEYANVRLVAGDAVVIAAATHEFARLGFDLYVERANGQAVRGALLAAGAAEVSADVPEAMRIERGRPLFPLDMDEETIPLEAGIEGRAISFTKGCYPGQEIITRILHRGHGRVARKLVGLRLEGEAPAARGDLIVSAGKDVGIVTSSAWSAALGRPIALGYVHRDFLAPGTELEVVRRGGGETTIRGTVKELPFDSAGTGPGRR